MYKLKMVKLRDLFRIISLILEINIYNHFSVIMYIKILLNQKEYILKIIIVVHFI